MRQHKVLKLLLVAVAFTVMLFAVGILFFNPSAREPLPRKEKIVAPGSSLNQPLQSPTSNVATSTSSTVNLSKPCEEAQWEIYRDEKYKFEIQYPKKGWGITSKMGRKILPYTAIQEPINIYTQRAVPTQGPISAPITITVYKKPSTILMEWLSGGYRTDLSKVKRGGVDTALARAYAFETGILTYNESRKNGMIIYEVGRASSNNYAFGYATFFVKEALPYVYEVSFGLPYYGSGWQAEPSDREYVGIYKKIISTFQFTD
jgi:hypothetical protein